MSFKTVSILGCGWLGLPLAQHLIRNHFLVRGSTTHSDKFSILQQHHITPYLISCSPNVQGGGMKEFLNSDVLVITIPFKRDLPDPAYYHQQITSIIKELKDSAVRQIIFSSSTSVYPQNIDLAVEDLEIIPDNPRAKVLLSIEKELLSQKFGATIVRFAGLYGPERRIGKFLAGKNDLPNPQQSVNLIHQEDCVRIIAQMIDRASGGEIFNACSDRHPTRQELYTLAAKKLGLPPPAFQKEMTSFRRIVSNEKLKKTFNYQFLHPDPLKDIE